MQLDLTKRKDRMQLSSETVESAHKDVDMVCNRYFYHSNKNFKVIFSVKYFTQKLP